VCARQISWVFFVQIVLLTFSRKHACLARLGKARHVADVAHVMMGLMVLVFALANLVGTQNGIVLSARVVFIQKNAYRVNV
jgi:hypothetical protein